MRKLRFRALTHSMSIRSIPNPTNQPANQGRGDLDLGNTVRQIVDNALAEAYERREEANFTSFQAHATSRFC